MRLFKDEVIKSKLGKRLIIYFITMGLLPLIIFTFFTTKYLTYFLIKNSKKEILKYCRISGQRIFETLAKGRTTLEILEKSECLSKNLIEKKDIERCLRIYLKENKEFSWIAIFSKEGRLIAKTSEINLSLINPNLNIKKVISLNKTVASEPYTYDINSFPTICLYAPIHKEDKIIGILAGEMKREFLWEITRGLYYLENANIFVIDNSGRILATSSNLKPYKLIFPKDIINKLFENNSGVGEVQDKRKDKIICGYYTVFLKGTFFTENWKIVITQDTKEILRLVNSFIKWFYIFLISGLSILILLSFYNIRRIILPIKILTEGTKHLKEGDTGYVVKIETKDEIGELANSFNEMSLRLKEKDERLLKSKSELEEEVEERTKELKEALQKLKITQGQIIHSEKLAAIGKLTSGVAHEINTPLTAIAGYSEAILRRIKEGRNKIDPEYLEKYLKIINEQTFQCKKIIEMLLSFSRPREIKFDYYEINKILLESINLAKQEVEVKNAKIIYNEKITEKIYIDGEQIKQVFLNIILNAIDAIKVGGEIKIELKENLDKLEISFTDNGEGIEEKNLEKIFDPFWTTKGDKGTGLGLSISQEIIKGHAGEIKVKSKKEEGSIFTVILPKIKREG